MPERNWPNCTFQLWPTEDWLELLESISHNSETDWLGIMGFALQTTPSPLCAVLKLHFCTHFLGTNEQSLRVQSQRVPPRKGRLDTQNCRPGLEMATI